MTRLRGTPRPLLAVAIGAALAALVALLVHTYSRPSIRMDGVGYYAPLTSCSSITTST